MSTEPITPEPVTPEPPRTLSRSVFVQTWARLTFLHWAVPPERVAAYLPPRVEPDTIDGVTYVGLVPFLMRHVGVLSGPPLPYLGSFCEQHMREGSTARW